MISNIFVSSFRAGVKLCFRFILFAFLLAPAFADGDYATSARKQTYVAVQRYAANLIRQEAKRRQWPEYQAKMNLFIPSEISQFAVCGQALSVSSSGGDRLDLNRLRVEVRCKDAKGWSIAVTVKPDIYLPVVVAENTLERDQVITADSLSLRKLNISGTRGDYLTRKEEATGLTVKRRIRENQPVTLNQLEQPLLVERGQRVLMVATQNGVEARTMGSALKKGRKGEMIKVKNESSGNIVSAIVADVGVVNTVATGG